MTYLPPTINTISGHSEMVRVLRHLQNRWGFSSALIGGGAIRDIYFQQFPKDVDIFLWDPSSKACPDPVRRNPRVLNEDMIWEMMDCRGDRSFWQRDWVEQGSLHDEDDEDALYFISKYITQVWNCVKEGRQYQLIFLNVAPLDYVNKYFDIGLCKAYCDGYKVRFTKDFSIDATQKTLTICGEDISKRHFDYILENHLARMKRKFPGYVARVAPHNLSLVDDGNKHLI